MVVADKVLGENTYALRPLIEGVKSFLDGTVNKFQDLRLVRVNMPGFDLAPGMGKLEYTLNGDDWMEATRKQVALDGRAQLERTDFPGRPIWLDLPKLRYRWIS